MLAIELKKENHPFVAVDWGSSNFRAYLLDDYSLIAEITADKGIIYVEKNTFETTLISLLTPWMSLIQDLNLPIIMGGMVGSDRGWIDAGYTMLPLRVKDIAIQTIQVTNTAGLNLYLKPGLAIKTKNFCNVMRGEEIQLLGVINEKTDCYLFPGTHSKWLSLTEKGMLETFHTVMTGELYALLMNHSLLGQEIESSVNDVAFNEGVLCAKAGSLDIIEQLFYARSARILRNIPADNVSSWLSGLLIGHEIKTQLQHFPDAKTFTIVAGKTLTPLYLSAFRHFSMTPNVISPTDAALNGFRSIYHELSY